MFRSAMSARARWGAHCAPERPHSGTCPNVQRISLPNARVAAVEKACARTQAQPKRTSGRRCGGRADRWESVRGELRAEECAAGGWGRCGRKAMPNTVVEKAPNVCAGKITGQNTSECVHESAHGAQQTENAMHLPGIFPNLMKMLPSEHPFQHALVGKMTSTFWKTRTRTKNDRAGLKATRAAPKATRGLAQAQPGRPEGRPGRAPTLEPQKSPGPLPRSEGRARADQSEMRSAARHAPPRRAPHGTLRLARSVQRSPATRGASASGGRAG